MAYTFSVNNTPTTGAIAIYTLISTLMSAGWLKKMDSDGTTYSATGVQVTSGASGAGGLGNTSAWVRLQAPAVNQGTVVNQTRELTFQRGTTDLAWRIKYSASALFTGGAPAAAVTPSSTDEVFMTGGGTDASPTYLGSWFPANQTYRWHIAAGGAAEYYSFVGWAVQTGTIATATMAIALDALKSGFPAASDVDPAVMYCSSASVNQLAFTELVSTAWPTSNVTNPAIARAWLGATSAVGASTVSNSQQVKISSYGTLSAGSGNALGNLTNPWTGKIELLPGIYGRGLASAAPKGIKGISTLFEVGSMIRTNMETCDSVGTKDKIYMAQLWLPWSGVKPII